MKKYEVVFHNFLVEGDCGRTQRRTRKGIVKYVHKMIDLSQVPHLFNCFVVNRKTGEIIMQVGE